MTAHLITYEGPASLAVEAATLLADGHGVELTSATGPQPVDGPPEQVRLNLTIEGATEEVTAAVARVAAGLPSGATITIDEGA